MYFFLTIDFSGGLYEKKENLSPKDSAVFNKITKFASYKIN